MHLRWRRFVLIPHFSEQNRLGRPVAVDRGARDTEECDLANQGIATEELQLDALRLLTSSVISTSMT